MAMERKTDSEDENLSPLDAAIEKANQALKKKGKRLFNTITWLKAGLLTAANINRWRAEGGIDVEPMHGKNNSIVLHFNKQGHFDRARNYAEHIATHNFAAPYAAKKFIDTILLANEVPNTSKQKWIGPDRLWVNEWITITSDPQSSKSLEQLMEYEYKPDERKWKLPYPYTEFANAIVRYHMGSHPAIDTRALTAQGKQLPTQEQVNDAIPGREEQRKTLTGRTRSDKPNESNKPKREGPSKFKGEGTHITAIAESLKMNASEARKILRINKIEKPYAWSAPADITRITEMLKKGRKK